MYQMYIFTVCLNRWAIREENLNQISHSKICFCPRLKLQCEIQIRMVAYRKVFPIDPLVAIEVFPIHS